MNINYYLVLQCKKIKGITLVDANFFNAFLLNFATDVSILPKFILFMNDVHHFCMVGDHRSCITLVSTR